MKLCFSTLGCPGRGLEAVIECAQKYQIGFLEIRGIGDELEAAKIECFTERNCGRSRDLLRLAGLRAAVFGSSCKFHIDGQLEQNLREADDCARLCRRIGIPFFRVFGDKITEPASPQKVARALERVCASAAEQDVAVLLEVHGDFNRLETLAPILERCSASNNFGLVWDIEHSDKAYGDNWPVFYEAIKGLVRHVHIKDYVRQTAENPFTLCLPGEGDIPVLPIVNRLLRDGYSGCFSLEWEKRWHPQLPPLETALECFIKLMNSAEVYNGGA